jgi:pimeloyl-ACP methyl ester carboxylesterase
MPTTATGTPYTVYSATLPTHGAAYWGVADAHTGSANIPAILYAHGSGGAANQFATLSAWDGLRDWLIDNGWAFIEGAGGGLTSWGNAAARAAYPAYLAHVEGILDIDKVVLLGRSMGGLVTAWLYAQYSGKARFSGWINNSGVSTIFEGTLGSGTVSLRPTGEYFGASMFPAWGVSDYAGLTTAAAAYAPESWAASVWAGKHILACYGDADTTVPFTPRGAGPLRAIWNGQPTEDLVSIRAGGDHTGTNGSYLDVATMSAFLYSIGGGGTPPEPPVPTYYRILNGWMVGPGGVRYGVMPKPQTIYV